tara:strand:- start:10 stop:120 length:111 start_codon:yes stop_codon:yes gene_type:complete
MQVSATLTVIMMMAGVKVLAALLKCSLWTTLKALGL